MTSHARQPRRRYRGEHRTGAWSVAGLVTAVERQADEARRAHIRSLRRPFDPGPIFLGTTKFNWRFYGVLPNTPDEMMTATLTLMPPDDGVATFPVIEPAPTMADDAPTGPIHV